jgi:hypothetical protein
MDLNFLMDLNKNINIPKVLLTIILEYYLEYNSLKQIENNVKWIFVETKHKNGSKINHTHSFKINPFFIICSIKNYYLNYHCTLDEKNISEIICDQKIINVPTTKVIISMYYKSNTDYFILYRYKKDWFLCELETSNYSIKVRDVNYVICDDKYIYVCTDEHIEIIDKKDGDNILSLKHNTNIALNDPVFTDAFFVFENKLFLVVTGASIKLTIIENNKYHKTIKLYNHKICSNQIGSLLISCCIYIAFLLNSTCIIIIIFNILTEQHIIKKIKLTNKLEYIFFMKNNNKYIYIKDDTNMIVLELYNDFTRWCDINN